MPAEILRCRRVKVTASRILDRYRAVTSCARTAPTIAAFLSISPSSAVSRLQPVLWPLHHERDRAPLRVSPARSGHSCGRATAWPAQRWQPHWPAAPVDPVGAYWRDPWFRIVRPLALGVRSCVRFLAMNVAHSLGCRGRSFKKCRITCFRRKGLEYADLIYELALVKIAPAEAVSVCQK